MKRIVLVAALVALTTFSKMAHLSASGVPSDRIAVWVTAASDGPSEFLDVDKGIEGTLRDLRSEIPKRRALRLARSEAEADLVLRVLARGIQSEQSGGMVMVPLGQSLYLGPTYNNAHVVRAFIEVGAYSKDVSVGLNGLGGVWKECAEQISKTVESWVKANQDRLLARRAEPVRR